MDERLERNLRSGLAALLDPIEGNYPRWANSPAARQVLRAPAHRRPGRGLQRRWAVGLAAVLVISLVAAALLLGQQLRQSVVTAPTPTPTATHEATPTPVPQMTVVEQESDVLAATRAHALPSKSSCPPGRDPNVPGPLYQERPAYDSVPMVFDRHAGVIVALVAQDHSNGLKPRTWIFDVCTNTWLAMHPLSEPADSVNGLVYDADSDRTIAVTGDGQIWSYDLAADSWAMVGSDDRLMGGFEMFYGYNRAFGAVYHDRSGLVVLYGNGSGTIWAYDVESNTLAKVRQRPDPALPADSGLPPSIWNVRDRGGAAIGYDQANDLIVVYLRSEYAGSAQYPVPQTWSFAPTTGAWRMETATATPDDWFVMGAPAVFDPDSSALLYELDPGLKTQVWVFDGARKWSGPIATVCGSAPVYDSVNSRLVCQAGTYVTEEGVPLGIYAGMATFSILDGRVGWLLEQLPTSGGISVATASPIP
jgi:hypothetical protein